MPERRLTAVGGAATSNGGGPPAVPGPPQPPDPPGWLSKDARTVWDGLAPHVPDGYLTPASAELFGMLCTSMASYREADGLVTEAGLLTAAGQDLVPNPALAVRNTQDALIMRWAREFGLTASSKPATPQRSGGMRHLREG